MHALLNAARSQITDLDAGGRGLQTFDQRNTIRAATARSKLFMFIAISKIDKPAALSAVRFDALRR